MPDYTKQPYRITKTFTICELDDIKKAWDTLSLHEDWSPKSWNFLLSGACKNGAPLLLEYTVPAASREFAQVLVDGLLARGLGFQDIAIHCSKYYGMSHPQNQDCILSNKELWDSISLWIETRTPAHSIPGHMA